LPLPTDSLEHGDFLLLRLRVSSHTRLGCLVFMEALMQCLDLHLQANGRTPVACKLWGALEATG
jgi:hypothetical protein|tara:strand:- start:4523 stop:4714 length:192 start_codon:yes stop_codon:yes gene_type:complete